jgi:hypothetical protein
VTHEESSAPAHPPTERDPEETPHACYEGVVFIGEMVDDYMGGEVEIFWPVPCRRCNNDDDR